MGQNADRRVTWITPSKRSATRGMKVYRICPELHSSSTSRLITKLNCYAVLVAAEHAPPLPRVALRLLEVIHIARLQRAASYYLGMRNI
jgi:hypothetical protein